MAYNIGVYESVQKFGNRITSGKITWATGPSKVVELLAESYAFYDAEMISQLTNSMIRAEISRGRPAPIRNVISAEVEYVMKQLKVAGISLGK